MGNVELCKCSHCGALVPEYCDGSGEVVCGECGESDHEGCWHCMYEGDDDEPDAGQRLAA